MVRTWMGTSTNKKFFFLGCCNFLDFTCSIYGQLCSSNKQNKWGTVSTLCVRRLSRRSSRCFDGRRVWAIVALSDPVFSIFYPCSEVFLQIFVLFFGPRSSIFLPKKGGGGPKSTESSSESVGAKKTITPCGSPSVVKETKKLAEDKTAVCAAAKQVGLSKV
jgi:hypothetical protein